jgi:hypothetical protein
VLFGTHLLRAACRAERIKENGSSDKASRIALFISSRPSSLDDDEASSEFKHKIAWPPCKILSRSSRVRDSILLEHRDKLVVDGVFREAPESQKKDNTPLLDLAHSDDLKYVDIFCRFFNVFF